MLKLLQSPRFAAAFGAVVYVAVLAALWPKIEAPLPPPTRVERIIAVRGPSWDYFNPELDELERELKQAKVDLAERDQQLNDLAVRLQAERAELNVVTQTVYQLQLELDRSIVRVQDEEAANLKRLAKVYSTMSPDGAAGILKQLDESVIVKILAFMKEGETAPILETLSRLGDAESRLAATLSERLRLAVFRPTTGKTKS